MYEDDEYDGYEYESAGAEYGREDSEDDEYDGYENEDADDEYDGCEYREDEYREDETNLEWAEDLDPGDLEVARVYLSEGRLVEALKFFGTAANRGDEEARSFLVQMHRGGEGGPKGAAEALDAADQMARDKAAWDRAHDEYASGEHDLERLDEAEAGMALEWFNGTAARGYAEALDRLLDMAKLGHDCLGFMFRVGFDAVREYSAKEYGSPDWYGIVLDPLSPDLAKKVEERGAMWSEPALVNMGPEATVRLLEEWGARWSEPARVWYVPPGAALFPEWTWLKGAHVTPLYNFVGVVLGRHSRRAESLGARWHISDKIEIGTLYVPKGVDAVPFFECFDAEKDGRLRAHVFGA
jgi:hypothetical protein